MARQISKKFVEEPGTSTRSRKQAGAGSINELEAETTEGGETLDTGLSPRPGQRAASKRLLNCQGKLEYNVFGCRHEYFNIHCGTRILM